MCDIRVCVVARDISVCTVTHVTCVCACTSNAGQLALTTCFYTPLCLRSNHPRAIQALQRTVTHPHACNTGVTAYSHSPARVSMRIAAASSGVEANRCMPEVCGLIDESGCKVRGCTVADAGAAQAFAVEEFGCRRNAWGDGGGGGEFGGRRDAWGDGGGGFGGWGLGVGVEVSGFRFQVLSCCCHPLG